MAPLTVASRAKTNPICDAAAARSSQRRSRERRYLIEQTSAVPKESTAIHATGMWNQAIRLTSPSPRAGGIQLNAAQITTAIHTPVRYFHQLIT